MRLGVDLGGSKIEAVILDEHGRAIRRRRVPAPASDYRALIAAVAGLVAEIEAETAPVPRAGIGIPGSIGPTTGRVRNANSTVLNGRDLAGDLEAVLDRPVRIANDANCFALAEAVAGAGQDAHLVFGVILGTGVGGGIAAAGRVRAGANRICGEWGHMPLPLPGAEEHPGPACYCGRQGCIETWVSGPGLAADHARNGGGALDPPAIAAQAEAGDRAARDSLARHLDRLARGLAQVVNILDPDAIVLGGGLSNLAHLPRELPSAMRAHVFSDSFETPIRANRLGDSAGVIGAAWLWPQA